MRMSQNIRALSPPPDPDESGREVSYGNTWKVVGSGMAIMSDSCTRANPSIDEPSKPMPSANAASSSAGATDTLFRVPSTSVNQSRTNRMSRSSSVPGTNSRSREVSYGNTGKVAGSGMAIMSDSCTRANPSIDEPSKPMPSANAASSSAGATDTLFRVPSTSVNQSRTNRMSRSSSVRRTNS